MGTRRRTDKPGALHRLRAGATAAFERDRNRDGGLTAAGYRVMRVTWKQIRDAPEVLLVRIARALS